MKPITKEEIQAILDSGVTKNFIEKKLKMGQGSIGKFLTGKLNSLPDKYAVGIRKIGKDIVITNEKLINVSTEVLNIMDKREVPINVGDDEAFNEIQEILKDNPEKNTGTWYLNPDSFDMRPINEDIYKKVEPINMVSDIMNEIKVPEESIIPEVKFLDERDNPLINAARGRDECGINLDEVQIKRPKINKDLLP